MQEKVKAIKAIPTGCKGLDEALKGGFPLGELSLVYGEAATGKTALAIQTAVEAARQGFKVIYVDADHSFTAQRLTQIAYLDADEVGPSITIFRPESFYEQRVVIEGLPSFVTESTKLVVVDSITSLYRVAITSPEEAIPLNRELSRQVAYLRELAARHNVAILLTGQVHARLEDLYGRVEPLARRVLTHMCKTMVQLKPTASQGVKEAIVESYGRHGVQFARAFLRLGEHGFEPLS